MHFMVILDMVRKEDVVIIISKSGSTDEISKLLPMFKRLGVKLIAMSGNPDSSLVKDSDIFLNISVKEEACPHDLSANFFNNCYTCYGRCSLSCTYFRKEDLLQKILHCFIRAEVLVKDCL
ncbi:MAG: SIS domain-containing protein [Ignavibacteriales bacterium]|nr:SIS domain-containing protein [Ignavibacteriales bacterium]